MENKKQVELENSEGWITPQIEVLSIKSETLGGNDNENLDDTLTYMSS